MGLSLCLRREEQGIERERGTQSNNGLYAGQGEVASLLTLLPALSTLFLHFPSRHLFPLFCFFENNLSVTMRYVM